MPLTPIVFTRAARAELLAAQDWYEAEREGLGTRFRASVDATVQRIAENPLQFPAVYREVRRALIRRFPYSVLYVVETNGVTVIACFHASRDPRQWQRRV